MNAHKEESKVRKKIFALILSIAVLITSLPFYATAVFASSPTIGISSAEAQPGDSVDLTGSRHYIHRFFCAVRCEAV